MGLADMDGFLDALTDTETLMETAKAAGGGMLGGALYDVATAKVKFLRSGTENVVMLKQLGTRVAMSVTFAALLGESQESLAKGYVGGTMAGFGSELLRRFVPDALTPSLDGYSSLARQLPPRQFQSQPPQQLQGSRVYPKGQIPSGLSALRVSTPRQSSFDSANLASVGI